MDSLTGEQIEQFVNDGFIRIDHAFPRELAVQGREILWRKTGCDPNDPSTWTKPVVWLGDQDEEPFRQAANTPRLRAAFDQLVGPDRWEPRQSLGTFPVRFPTSNNTGDTGWHVDASFPGEGSDPADFLSWRVNVRSRGRALLMLFLFSDVEAEDAPTRIRIGSHLDVARLLEPHGEAGLGVSEINYRSTDGRAEVLATGEAGTVYLCHPFLVHGAQVNRGRSPRFMAQPPLLPKQPLDPFREALSQLSPVELAVRRGLEP